MLSRLLCLVYIFYVSVVKGDEPAIPVFLRAFYSLDENIVRAHFDSDVTYDGRITSFPCSSLFSFSGDAAATCRWVSYQEVDITMPTDGTTHVIMDDELVLKGGILQAKCPTDYPNPSECTFFQKVPLTAVTILLQEPKLLSAVFFSDGSILRVSFDYAVTFPGWMRSFPCVYLFSYAGAVTSTCHWVNSKIIDISFPSGASYGAVVGDLLTMYYGVLLPKCAESFPFYSMCDYLAPIPTDPVTITAAEGAEPTVQLPVELKVTYCLAPVIDASSSYGSGGRKWISANVNITTESSSGDAMMAYMNDNIALFIDSKPMEIPTEYIESGHTYHIKLTLCNFLGFCSSSTMRLVVEANPLPVIIIQQGSRVRVQRNSQLNLFLSYSLPFCDGSNLPSSQMGFNWTLFVDGAVVNVASTTRDKTKYQLAPYSLLSGKTYSVLSTVWNKVNPSQIASVTTLVDVNKADVDAVILGNVNQLLPFDKTLIFDASGSIDKNEPSNAQPILIYSWSCVTTTPQILSSCPSLVLSGTSSARLSVEFIEEFYDTFAYTLTVLVSDPSDSHRSDTAVVTATLLPPQAPEVVLTKSITSAKVNSFVPFRLRGGITLKATETVTWSVNDSSVVLSNVLSVPPTRTLEPGTHSIIAALTLSGLDRGVPYLFSLRCGTSVSSVTVVVNAPPNVGQFQVTPANGVEITDVFTFSTSFWTDLDTPIQYEFGFITTDSSRLVVQSAAPRTSTRTVLPAGAELSNYFLVCSVRAFDNLGAFSSTTTSVQVRPFSGNELAAALKDSINEAGTLDSLKRTISVSSAVLNTGNCALAPDCAAINRNPCSQVANTCGSCISPFIGEPGVANTPCISETDYYGLEEYVENCNVDSDCPAWKKCNTEEFLCEMASKTCNWDCSSHGTCSYSHRNGESINDCKMNDFTCSATCNCDSGYFGFGCNSTHDSLEETSDVREFIITKMAEALDLDDFSIDSSIGLISMLKAAAQDSFTLTEGSSDLTVAIGETLISVADGLGIPINDMYGILESLQSVLLTYRPSSTRRNLRGLNSNTLKNIIDILEKHGSTVANKWLAAGSGRNDAILDVFTTSAEVFSADAAASTATPDTGIGGFRSHSVSFLSDAKEMKVLTTVMQSNLYPMARELHSNPLKLTVMAANASSTVRFIIQHNQDIFFDSRPSNISFRTYCLEYSQKEEVFTCPDGFKIFHKCNGTSSILSSKCKGLKTISVCRSVNIFGFDPRVNCTYVSNTASSTTCVCDVLPGSDNGRRLESGSSQDTGYLEIAAMSEQAIADFEGTLYESRNFDSPEDLEDVITIIIMFGAMWTVGLLGSYYFSLRSALDQNNKKNMNLILKDTRLNALAKNTRTVESIKRYMNNYIDQVFPTVYGSSPWYKRLVKEVLKHHRYMSLFSSDSTPKERFTTTVHLLTVQTMLMFMLAVFYDIQFPVDDGSCDGLTVETCEDEKSVFNTADSVCIWNSESALCAWKEPYIGWEIVIIISIVVAVFTAPVNLVVDFLFNEVLAAPTADSLKLQAQDNAMKRAGRRMSNAVRRASTQATAALSSAMQAVGDGGNKYMRKNMRITTTRMIPGETQTAQSLAIASTSSVVDSFKQSRESFKSHRETLVGRNKVAGNDNASIALALTNTNDPSIRSVALFSEFEKELYAQREVLRVAERPVFDENWGLNSSGVLSDDVPGHMCFKNQSAKQIVKDEILEVQKEALRKFEKLNVATDAQVGIELLHVFVLDLLGRQTPAAKIFIAKSSEDFRHAMVVSQWAKRAGWLIITVLNIFFVYFSILRGMQRGQKWQEGYAIACVVQFAVEIFMFETIECIWMNYLIPDAVSTEIQVIKFQLRRTVDDLCSTSTSTYKYFLDVPEYLFVSSFLVKRFPDKLESMIIASYHQHLPGELAKKWKTRSSFSSRFLRNMSLFAVTNAIMKLIGTTPPTLQRVVVHSAQPLIFAAFAVFIIFLMNNPLFITILALPILYQMCVGLYNYVTTGKAFPSSESDLDNFSNKGNGGQVHHRPQSHHNSSFYVGNDVENPTSTQPLHLPAKPKTPPTAVMPQSMADTIIKSQEIVSVPAGASGKSAKKKGRSTIVKKATNVRPLTDESYSAVGLLDPVSEMEAKPASSPPIAAQQLSAKDNSNPKKSKKKSKTKKDSESRPAAGVHSPEVELTVPTSLAVPPPVQQRTVISFNNSDDSSDLTTSSEEESYFERGDSKKWEEKR